MASKFYAVIIGAGGGTGKQALIISFSTTHAMFMALDTSCDAITSQTETHLYTYNVLTDHHSIKAGP